MTFPTESPFGTQPEAKPLVQVENLRPAQSDKDRELARKTTAIDHIIGLFYEDLDDQTRLNEIWDTVEEFA